jgi:hypothetical protein
MTTGIRGGCTRSKIESALKRLVALSDLFLRYVGELDNLSKRPGYRSLPACDEQARSYNGIGLFSAEEFFLFATPVEHFGGVGDGTRERVLVAHGLYLFEYNG